MLRIAVIGERERVKSVEPTVIGVTAGGGRAEGDHLRSNPEKVPFKQAELDDYGRNSYFPGMTAIVSEKGQVTIPKAVRDILGIAPGTILEFRAADGKVVVTKKADEDVFRKWRGKGKGVVEAMGGVDEYLRIVRGV